MCSANKALISTAQQQRQQQKTKQESWRCKTRNKLIEVNIVCVNITFANVQLEKETPL